MTEFVNKVVNSEMLTVNYSILLYKSAMSTQKEGGVGLLTPWGI
jgi:hypothetical protein